MRIQLHLPLIMPLHLVRGTTSNWPLEMLGIRHGIAVFFSKWAVSTLERSLKVPTIPILPLIRFYMKAAITMKPYCISISEAKELKILPFLSQLRVVLGRERTTCCFLHNQVRFLSPPDKPTIPLLSGLLLMIWLKELRISRLNISR